MREPGPQHRFWRGGRFHLFAAGLFIAIVTGWVALMALATRDSELPDESSGMVTVVFPWGSTIRDVFLTAEKAGGSIVGDTFVPNVWVMHSDAPGYAARLRAAGVLFVLDVSPFKGLRVPTCGGV